MLQPKFRYALICASYLCILAIGACGTRNTQQPVLAGAADASPWFCQVSERGNTDPWDCVQDAEQANNPQPTRLPPNIGSQPEALPTSTSIPISRPTPDTSLNGTNVMIPAINAQVEQPSATSAKTEQPTPPPPRLQTPTGETPEYVALAYHPSEPVSILDLPRDFFAVQLTALNSPEAVEAFVNQNHLLGMSAAQVAAGDELRYVLILGIYETEDKARRALQELPGPLAQFDPWLRRVGHLQDAMVAAHRLNAQ